MSDCDHEWEPVHGYEHKACPKCGSSLLKTEHTIKSDVEGEEWRVWKIEPPLVFKVTL
jgi:DNA-directed RNA polymerase subunit RPC12/RpoP